MEIAEEKSKKKSCWDVQVIQFPADIHSLVFSQPPPWSNKFIT